MLDALRLSLNATAVYGFIIYIIVAALLFALFQFCLLYTSPSPRD